MAKYKVVIHSNVISPEEVIADIQNVAQKLGVRKITRAEYDQYGNHGSTTVGRKFGSWNKALSIAGLEKNEEKNISEENLFKNLVEVWSKLGRQPRRDEIKTPLSQYGSTTYVRKYGSWNKALLAFEGHINSQEDIHEGNITDTSVVNTIVPLTKDKHKTKRDISSRLRFAVLQRDNFCCKSCGRSPATTRGVKLHVDHIIPWSKGGETVMKNLECKCKECNLGKGNAFNK